MRKKIDDVFGHTLGISEKRALATLIYYPRERLEMEKKQQEDIDDWYKVMLYRLIDVCKIVSSKYTRAKVRKALPADYGYIIEELITEKPEVLDKEAYYEAIIQTILEIGSAENFIIAPLDIEGMVIHQAVHDFIRLRTAVKDVADDVEMIRANALPQKAARTAEIPSRCWSAACTRPSP